MGRTISGASDKCYLLVDAAGIVLTVFRATPRKIRAQIFDLLETLAEDLPDITPRRFIRHPIVQSFLTSKFPFLISPTLADWHLSLSNRAHIKAYIKQALETFRPFGTGWAGTSLVLDYQQLLIASSLYQVL